MTPTTTIAPSIFPELAGTRRFTSEQYRRMIDGAILGPDDRVDLRDGYVLYKDDSDLPPDDGPFPQWRALRRFSSAEYHRMLELGIIDWDEKLELLDGYVVLKMSQSIAHRASVVRLTTRLPTHLPAGWVVMPQVPISVGIMEPQPDGSIVRGIDSDYDSREVLEADLGIVIEVSDSSLEMDRAAKGRLYARAGIPVYWIINVVDRQIEVYTNPDPAANPPEYRSRTDYHPGDTVPVVLDGRQAAAVPVAELIV
jgi:Uma2 family endonuclease